MDYLFFRTPFAFFDYDKAGWLVFLENMAMLECWVLIAALMTRLLNRKKQS